MFKSAMHRSVGVIPRSLAITSFNKQFVGAPVALVRYNSSFDQLKNSKANQKSSNSKKNNNGINDINELLNSSLELSENSAFLHSKSSDYGLGDVVPNPRDVAKNIREMGPVAGRAVDVHYGGLGKAFAGVRRLGFTNKIKHYQKVQERYIRPAKYAKQKKREWWRRKFSEGFKDLMSQVNDARRRGY
ncbi:predicted protein [Scheffersomyces stipitis CBS 6054]|uniref:Uncharacterized protein n=1 Tax=Scheffersomyces stipitis (strain ATCC 58785 / CBS 6054 / NBRC 10063 / NRRL Y-11545) TaxID=322104 RepID=A3LQY6_PICST|nr:predicted protein [Scheffersomyces stipitis CBS 6054]ABN65639.1 predicted protein [Scheffersomyces stipitis CBS 6054]KAG2733511.1 hypothetical protein G9P44_003036 [Scheffersomyces stipitis]